MSKFYILFVLLLVTFRGVGQDITSRLDHYLSRPKKNNNLNGTALVVHRGNILLFKGYGYKNAATKTLNDTCTIYRIGSLSKPFTSAVILQLAEQQVLSFTDTIGKFFPGYPHGNLITVEHLLTHSSGVKEYLGIKEIQELPDSAPPIAMDKLIGYFRNEPLDIRPGEKFAYSNSNYILLAAIVEKITGEKFEQVVRHQIFEPLGMQHSGFDFNHLADTNKSTGHFSVKKGHAIPADFDSTYAPGCGSMYATAMDLYQWYRGLYNGKVFKDSTREQAFVPRKSDYGYGWFNEKKKGRTCISHAGGVPGFVANLQFYPAEDLCVIMLSNDNGRDIFIDSDKLAEIALRKK
jgi:CubicO group peptidase (beta-lactamase class C family)